MLTALPSVIQPRLQYDRKAFAKLMAVLHAKAERTVDALWAAVGQAVTTFPPQECTNCFISLRNGTE